MNTLEQIIKDISKGKSLTFKESKEIFCIGDCAFQKDVNGVDVPSVAQGAIQAGNFVADQIIFDLKKKKRQRFSYKNKGEMAGTPGRRNGPTSTGCLTRPSEPLQLKTVLGTKQKKTRKLV